MKTNPVFLCASFALTSLALTSLLLTAPLAIAHPDHGAETKTKSGASAMSKPAEKAYGRAGEVRAVTRTVNLNIESDMRLSPAEIKVKQGETIKLVVKNSAKALQGIALGTASELKERAALIKQFPKMEMNQPDQLQVKPGESGELIWQFTNPGEFNLGCSASACLNAGMVGKIVVAP